MHVNLSQEIEITENHIIHIGQPKIHICTSIAMIVKILVPKIHIVRPYSIALSPNEFRAGQYQMLFWTNFTENNL